MPGAGLPTNLDVTYADDGTDASVKAHQQYHDTIHGFVDQFDTATRSDRNVFVYDSASGLFVPRGLTSADVGITTWEQVTGNYTFVLADVGKGKYSSAADTTAVTYTIPANATVPFPIGTTIRVKQRGTGQIQIVGESATVVLNGVGGGTKTSAQNADLLLDKLFTDTWYIANAVT